jgi:hypothetical protein
VTALHDQRLRRQQNTSTCKHQDYNSHNGQIHVASFSNHLHLVVCGSLQALQAAIELVCAQGTSFLMYAGSNHNVCLGLTIENAASGAVAFDGLRLDSSTRHRRAFTLLCTGQCCRAWDVLHQGAPALQLLKERTSCISTRLLPGHDLNSSLSSRDSIFAVYACALS